MNNRCVTPIGSVVEVVVNGTVIDDKGDHPARVGEVAADHLEVSVLDPAEGGEIGFEGRVQHLPVASGADEAHRLERMAAWVGHEPADVVARVLGDHFAGPGREVELDEAGRVRVHARDDPGSAVIRGERGHAAEGLVGAPFLEGAPVGFRVGAQAQFGAAVGGEGGGHAHLQGVVGGPARDIAGVLGVQLDGAVLEVDPIDIVQLAILEVQGRRGFRGGSSGPRPPPRPGRPGTG